MALLAVLYPATAHSALPPAPADASAQNARLAFVRDEPEPASHGGSEDAVSGRAGDGEAVGAGVGDALGWLGGVGPFDDAA